MDGYSMFASVRKRSFSNRFNRADNIPCGHKEHVAGDTF